MENNCLAFNSFSFFICYETGVDMSDIELLQEAFDFFCHYIKINEIGQDELQAEAEMILNAIQARLAQPEPEPVAWSYWQSCLNDDGTQTAPFVHRFSKFKPTESIINKDIVPLYTTLPKKEWVGLTNNEVKSMTHRNIMPWMWKLIGDIEAKLKEKNGMD